MKITVRWFTTGLLVAVLVAGLGVEEPVATGPGDSNMEAQQPEEHGLTIRVKGGFVAPNTSDLVALGVALLLAAGGIAFVLGKGAAR